jgi:peptidoglycan/LPS O-acetylase OafA/YrhL
VILSLMSYVLASILLGIVTSYLIEKPFLKIRDKYFPRKA